MHTHQPQQQTVMWLNGGPGASSLIGFFTENGPFSLNDDSINANGTVPTLFRNPYGWSSAASMLYIESPAGVGFSYCEKAEDCWFDDTKTAQDNYDFVAAFFDAYSEYKARDFYITGESCECFFAHPAMCRPLAQLTADASSIVHTRPPKQTPAFTSQHWCSRLMPTPKLASTSRALPLEMAALVQKKLQCHDEYNSNCCSSSSSP